MAATVLRLPRTLGEYWTLLMVEETGVPGGNHRYVIRAKKSLLYGATYLVPQAVIEPTPRTDIGYRPVSQTHQSHRELLDHHVPKYTYRRDRI
jgi:hypothetical protein